MKTSWVCLNVRYPVPADHEDFTDLDFLYPVPADHEGFTDLDVLCPVPADHEDFTDYHGFRCSMSCACRS